MQNLAGVDADRATEVVREELRRAGIEETTDTEQGSPYDVDSRVKGVLRAGA
jgi:hypothetical protein